MTPKKVYLETSVISYLTALPSRDVVKLAKQELTWEWWRANRQRFELYISPAVLEEISLGDSEAIERRVNVVTGLPILDLNNDVTDLLKQLLAANIVPAKAAADALHIAIAAVHGMSYLLTL